MSRLPENATDEQRLQAYRGCLREQGFDISSLVNLSGNLANSDLRDLPRDLAQTMFQSAENGQGCAALLTQQQRDEILQNQWVHQRDDGYESKVDTH
jgi:hypothetical protein